MTISTKPYRAFPALPDPGGTLTSHAAFLRQVREAIETHERRNNNYLDSFIRLRELVDLGLIQIEGDQVSVGDDDGPVEWDDIVGVPIYTESPTPPTWEYTLDGISVGNVGFAAATDDIATGSVAGDLVLSPVSGRVFIPANAVEIQSAAPILFFDETDAAADERQWHVRTAAGVLRLDTYSDAGVFGANAIAIDRTGTVVSEIEFNAVTLDANGDLDLDGTTHTLDGTTITVDAATTLTLAGGSATVTLAGSAVTPTVSILAPNGAATAGSVSYSFTNDTDTGMYLFGTNDIGWAAAGTTKMLLSDTRFRVSAAAQFVDAALNVELESAEPVLLWDETDAAANERQWRIRTVAGLLRLDTYSDAGAVGANALAIDRNGTTVTTFQVNATTVDLNGNLDADGTTMTIDGTTVTLTGGSAVLAMSGSLSAFTNAVSATGQMLLTGSGGTATPPLLINAAIPIMELRESDAAANNRRWLFYANGEDLFFTVRNDANSTEGAWLTVQRTLNTIDEIQLDATTFDFNGALDVDVTGSHNINGTVAVDLVSGSASISAIASGAEVDLTGTTIDANGNLDLDGTTHTLDGTTITIDAATTLTLAGGSATVTLAGSTVTSTVPHLGSSGSESLPSYAFSAAADSGMYWIAADIAVAFAVDGAFIAEIYNDPPFMGWYFGDGASEVYAELDSGAGEYGGVTVLSAANLRWFFGKDTSAESGSNVGGDFVVQRYNDAGALIADALTINRATGTVAVTAPVQLAGYTVGTLPAGTIGMTAYVTDALAPAFGAAVVGGGAVMVPVYYTGAAWFVG